jgi:hypothetical protein
MKRALTLLLAVAAVACTKTEVAYDSTQSNEIALMPVPGKITKAAITDGNFRTDNHIALYAYWTADVPAGNVVADADYDAFAKKYFDNTEFYCMNADSKGSKIWAGLQPYYWPATGSMVFAGYSLDKPTAPNVESKQNGTPSYDLDTDCLTITGYTQSNQTDKTYDLLYFGRTAESYDRNTLTVPVVFQHALSWIEIQVKGGVGALVEGRTWAITKVEFKGVATKGTFTYTGTATDEALKAVWSDQTVLPTAKSVVVFNEVAGTRARQALTSGYAKIENVNAGTLVLPQDAKKLYVTIEYMSPANDLITEVVEINIPAQTPKWEAGKKYVYQITFSPQEILVAPTVQTWPAEGQEGYVNTTWPSNN